MYYEVTIEKPDGTYISRSVLTDRGSVHDFTKRYNGYNITVETFDEKTEKCLGTTEIKSVGSSPRSSEEGPRASEGSPRSSEGRASEGRASEGSLKRPRKHVPKVVVSKFI